MKRWMRVVVLALLTAFAAATVDPPPAAAGSTQDIIIYSAAGVGVAIVIVLVATYMTRDEDQLFLAEPPADKNAPSSADSAIHFGANCRNPDGTIALACW